MSPLGWRVSVTLALFLLPSPALANGKFPAAGQIVVDPGDAARVIVRSTFGLLVSSDSGAHFDWICEKGAGYGGGYDPGIAVAAGGTILAGVPDGISVGREGACVFSHAAGSVDRGFVPDVSVQRGHPATAVALRKGDTGSADSVYLSTDSGGTWAKAGADLPSGFTGATIDLAPSDATRIYAAGTHLVSGSLRGALARSKDGGSSWELTDLPPPFDATTPYLAAVDPVDPAIVYARLDGTPGRLLVSKDAGGSFTEVLKIPGFIKAFALSPDGKTALAGGPADGLWRASAGELSFAKVSSMAATCLAWEGERIYACSDLVLVSLSTDMGSSFSPLLSLRCVGGPLSCAPSTSVGAVCPAMWGPIAQQIGASPCGPPDGGAASSGSSAPDAGAPPGDGGSEGEGEGGSAEPKPKAGCGGCRVGQRGASGEGALFALALLGLFAARRAIARGGVRDRASARACPARQGNARRRPRRQRRAR